MFNYEALRELSMPSKGMRLRVPNRLKKGYLKKSIFPRWTSFSQAFQGEREKARRRRQIERGILKVSK